MREKCNKWEQNMSENSIRITSLQRTSKSTAITANESVVNSQRDREMSGKLDKNKIKEKLDSMESRVNLIWLPNETIISDKYEENSWTQRSSEVNGRYVCDIDDAISHTNTITGLKSTMSHFGLRFCCNYKNCSKSYSHEFHCMSKRIHCRNGR